MLSATSWRLPLAPTVRCPLTAQFALLSISSRTILLVRRSGDPENINEMARIAAHTRIPIATGERLVKNYEFAQVLEKQAAQILQLDVGQCGGNTEAKKIASMAEAHYAIIAPHMYCGPVAFATAIQFDTCSPNFLIQEANQGPLHKKIFKEPLVFENGYILPPTGPGLGIEFDQDVLKSHLVELGSSDILC